MARPKKNNLDYFPHDNKMRNDRKIKALRSKFGCKGYAIYNMLLEILCESELLIIKWDEKEIELVSGDFNIVSEELTEITDYLILIELLQKIDGWLFCEQLDKRSKMVFDKRIESLDSLRRVNGVNTTETLVSGKKSTQSKVKESKGKESKVKESPLDFIEPKFKKLFNEWLKYRKEIKRPFKSNMAIKGCYNQLIKLSDGNLETAKEIVDRSISNQWQGLFDSEKSIKGKFCK